jgi:hypothetical protein
LVDGQVVRCEKPTRAHQSAASRITAMLDAAAEAHLERNPGTCLDTGSDFDVLLWEVPAATIRSPDAALFDCAPSDLRPMPAFHLKVVVEVVSPGSRKADKLGDDAVPEPVTRTRSPRERARQHPSGPAETETLPRRSARKGPAHPRARHTGISYTPLQSPANNPADGGKT